MFNSASYISGEAIKKALEPILVDNSYGLDIELHIVNYVSDWYPNKPDAPNIHSFTYTENYDKIDLVDFIELFLFKHLSKLDKSKKYVLSILNIHQMKIDKGNKIMFDFLSIPNVSDIWDKSIFIAEKDLYSYKIRFDIFEKPH